MRNSCFRPKIIKTRYTNLILSLDFTCRNQLQQTFHVCWFQHVCVSSIYYLWVKCLESYVRRRPFSCTVLSWPKRWLEFLSKLCTVQLWPHPYWASMVKCPTFEHGIPKITIFDYLLVMMIWKLQIRVIKSGSGTIE